MADTKITGLTDLATLDNADIVPVVDDVAGTPITKKFTFTTLKSFLKTYFDTLYSSATTAVTLVPQPNFVYSNSGVQLASLNSNTTQYYGQIVVPFKITVNKISIDVNAVTVAGTFDIVLYSEDGQTQLISVTTASISATGTNTTAVGSVVIPAGVYYIAINPNGTVNCDIRMFQTFNEATLSGGVTSEPRLCGTATITAGTPASTFDPASITSVAIATLICRLDN